MAFSSVTWAQNSSHREQIQKLFNESQRAATFEDFPSDPALSDKKQSCVIFPDDTTRLPYSAWFLKRDLALSPVGPLFPGKDIKTVIFSTFKKSEGYPKFSYNLNPQENIIKVSDRELSVSYWGDISLPNEGSAHNWMSYVFRKSNDLIVFKVNFTRYLDNKYPTLERDAHYGYCWKK
jgi:hypothetical protein